MRRIGLVLLACVVSCGRSHNTESRGADDATIVRRPFSGSEDMSHLAAVDAHLRDFVCPGNSLVPHDKEHMWRTPRVPVHLKAFAIDRHLVTCDDVTACRAAGGCTNSRYRVRCESGSPILSVDSAAEYCAWRGARLPTWFEWQYAAYGADGPPELGTVGEPPCDAERPQNSVRGCRMAGLDGFAWHLLDYVDEHTADTDCEYETQPRRLPLHIGLGAFEMLSFASGVPAAFRCARDDVKR